MIKIIFSTFFLITTNVQATDLNVSVYYETLCPDSIRFIVNQLYPTYKQLGNDFELDLIPFGNAEAKNASGQWEFTCQHGPRECYGNKVQSCFNVVYSVPASVEFVNCALSSADPADDAILQQCIEKLGLNWSEIEECLNSGQGDELLAENGRKTKAVQPPISWIPTIIFDDVYNATLQDSGEHHFFDTICELLNDEPDGCLQNNVIVKLV